MLSWSIVVIIIGVLISLICIQTIIRTEKPLKKAFCGVFKGILALMAVNLTGAFTGVTIPISILSLCISILGGIPGVTTLVILDMIF